MGGDPRAEKTRHGIAIAFALAVHASFYSILSFVPEKSLAIPEAPIPVRLVILDTHPPAETPSTDETPVEAKPKSPPQEPPVPPPTQSLEPVQTDVPPEPPRTEILVAPEPTTPPTSVPLSILSTEDPHIGDPIPDRWRLPDGARIPLENTQQPRNPNLEALTKALDCLGFDSDCAVQRKSVFAEDQLTGTDLVWMRSYAHSGLSDSSLYGLSEAEIQKRLGIMVAGKNGFTILPGIELNGPWWDALHGVNKACKYGLGVNDLGQKQLMKSCGSGKPSSKDRIAFIPKPVE